MAKKKKETIHIEVTDYDTFETEMNREFGKDVLRDADRLENPLPNFSGSHILDIDLAIPMPEGRIIEIFGAEGSGKTTVGLEILGQAQSRGKRVLYVNAEENLDRSLVDGIRTLDPGATDEEGNKTFQIIQFMNGTAEQYLGAVERFLSSFKDTVCLVDSVDSLIPESVLAGDYGDANMGSMGKFMSTAMRRIKGICAATRSTIIFINQLRKKFDPFGDPRVTPGGEALKFYASQRVRFEAIGKGQQIFDEDKSRVIGHRVRYYIVKNKAAPPFIENSFPIIYGRGIYREYELAQLIKDLGVVETSGPRGCYIHIDETKYTLDQIAGLFESDPDLYKKYVDKIHDIYFSAAEEDAIQDA